MDMSERFDQFVRYLRSALHHLYDPDELRRSPLVDLLGVAHAFDTASALQRLLTDGIEAVKPAADEPARSRAWRMYETLIYHYVRGWDRAAVADQLAISDRQFRREQRAAIEVLAAHLWQRHAVEGRVGDSQSRRPEAPAGSAPPVSDDLAWLTGAAPDEFAGLNEVMDAVLSLVRPLARRWNVAVRAELASSLPALAVPRVVLKNALLTLFAYIIPRAAGAQVSVSATTSPVGVELEIVGAGLNAAAETLPDRASLDMARQILDVYRCTLTFASARDSFGARLLLPTHETVTVLVIDDNAHAIQLLRRYASGTCYAIIGAREPATALGLVERHRPRVIVLDVMMPDVDGWEVFGQLRQHSLASQIPVVICTILPQAALAGALGAGAYLQKPVTRQAFLAALDRLAPSPTEVGGISSA
jgi:CheY-like chemotaxis protein